MSDRKFRLALQIKEADPEIPGAHVMMALADEPHKDSPVLTVVAGGFPTNDTGAALLADMLTDAAEAIREYLSDAVIAGARSTDTASLPTLPLQTSIVQPQRPRFNPQPMGK